MKGTGVAVGDTNDLVRWTGPAGFADKEPRGFSRRCPILCGRVSVPPLMEASEMDVLAERLVADPHDQEALAIPHQAETADPRSSALLLEKIGSATTDAAYASYWLTEAANVWSSTLGDAHRAARVLLVAVDRDP